MEAEFSKLLNISDKKTKKVITKICSYCNKPFTESRCKECYPYKLIEGVDSGNPVIDKFIIDTIYDTKPDSLPLEWVPYDRFTDIKEIGEGGFAKVYSATWINGIAISWEKQKDGSYKEIKVDSKIALKKLNGSQNITDKYLNELKIHYIMSSHAILRFYGITKDPETKEFMMIIEFAKKGNLRNILLSNFNEFMWKDKIILLRDILYNLRNLHNLGYFHKDFHSGNILRSGDYYISDFGLSGPANEQKSDDKVYGVMPYVAPEVLNGEPYTLSSDIYSVGVVMTELSSGKPPFYDKKHDLSLALDICDGLRPEFGKGTPEFYKKLAYKCMNANSNERPTAEELKNIFDFWCGSIDGIINDEKEVFGYKRKEIKAAFEEADKEIPNISTLYEKNSAAIYTSRAFNFSNLLSKPINSAIITSYVSDKDYDSQLIDLKIPNSIQLRGSVDENRDDE